MYYLKVTSLIGIIENCSMPIIPPPCGYWYTIDVSFKKCRSNIIYQATHIASYKLYSGYSFIVDRYEFGEYAIRKKKHLEEIDLFA